MWDSFTHSYTEIFLYIGKYSFSLNNNLKSLVSETHMDIFFTFDLQLHEVEISN
jgi:hypothetical protein